MATYLHKEFAVRRVVTSLRYYDKERAFLTCWPIQQPQVSKIHSTTILAGKAFQLATIAQDLASGWTSDVSENLLTCIEMIIYYTGLLHIDTQNSLKVVRHECNHVTV